MGGFIDLLVISNFFQGSIKVISDRDFTFENAKTIAFLGCRVISNLVGCTNTTGSQLPITLDLGR
jgi:hypothetical protein